MTQHKPPTLAITGGKGGTGKTLIATNFAVQFANTGKKVLLIDCDVENPNTFILLGKKIKENVTESKPVKIFKPFFDQTLCTKCSKCQTGCYRHAILQFPERFPSLIEHLCSGCETCLKICPTSAIKADARPIGNQYFLKNIFPNLDLLIGELNPTEAVSVLVIKEILANGYKFIDDFHYDIIIIDTSPGAHCDVEMVLNTATNIICVTEPTPFGEHDLLRILDLIQLIHKDATIILNRSNMSDYREPIFTVAKQRSSPILGEIPLDDQIIEDYAKGLPFVNDLHDFPAKKAFLEIFQKVKIAILEEKGK